MLSETTASETAERGLRRAAAPARRVSAQGGTVTDPSVTPGQPLAPAHRSVGPAPRKSVRDEAVSRPALEHLPKTTVEEFVLTQLSVVISLSSAVQSCHIVRDVSAGQRPQPV